MKLIEALGVMARRREHLSKTRDPNRKSRALVYIDQEIDAYSRLGSAGQVLLGAGPMLESVWCGYHDAQKHEQDLDDCTDAVCVGLRQVADMVADATEDEDEDEDDEQE